MSSIAADSTVAFPSPPSPLTATKPRKITGKRIAGRLITRSVNPKRLWQAFTLQRNRKSHRHTYDDAQLAFYAKILPTGFLHFGYFDDVDRMPEDMSLAEVLQSQHRYADVLMDLAGPPVEGALDVGCGMGGLSRMLRDRGYAPIALTPDRLQVSHIHKTMPDVPVIRAKLEDMKAGDYATQFGTVFTAESLQYLKLDKALPILTKVLKPGGRWVACDFFHSGTSTDKTCHVWDEFVAKLDQHGWRIRSERNITPHVLPTLRYIHMWATRFGLPLLDFAELRLRRKQPGVHHMLETVLHDLHEVIDDNIGIIDPAKFSAHKRYMLLVMERAE